MFLSQICIAAFHMEQGDTVAVRRSLDAALRSFLVLNGRLNTLRDILRGVPRRVFFRLMGKR
jgi:hypothetical protein